MPLRATSTCAPKRNHKHVCKVDETNREEQDLLMLWASQLLVLDIRDIKQVQNGAVFCQILHAMDRASVNMAEVDFAATSDLECHSNFETLEAACYGTSTLSKVPRWRDAVSDDDAAWNLLSGLHKRYAAEAHTLEPYSPKDARKRSRGSTLARPLAPAPGVTITSPSEVFKQPSVGPVDSAAPTEAEKVYLQAALVNASDLTHLQGTDTIHEAAASQSGLQSLMSRYLGLSPMWARGGPNFLRGPTGRDGTPTPDDNNNGEPRIKVIRLDQAGGQTLSLDALPPAVAARVAEVEKKGTPGMYIMPAGSKGLPIGNSALSPLASERNARDTISKALQPLESPTSGSTITLGQSQPLQPVQPAELLPEGASGVSEEQGDGKGSSEKPAKQNPTKLSESPTLADSPLSDPSVAAKIAALNKSRVSTDRKDLGKLKGLVPASELTSPKLQASTGKAVETEASEIESGALSVGQQADKASPSCSKTVETGTTDTEQLPSPFGRRIYSNSPPPVEIPVKGNRIGTSSLPVLKSDTIREALRQTGAPTTPILPLSSPPPKLPAVAVDAQGPDGLAPAKPNLSHQSVASEPKQPQPVTLSAENLLAHNLALMAAQTPLSHVSASPEQLSAVPPSSYKAVPSVLLSHRAGHEENTMSKSTTKALDAIPAQPVSNPAPVVKASVLAGGLQLLRSLTNKNRPGDSKSSRLRFGKAAILPEEAQPEFSKHLDGNERGESKGEPGFEGVPSPGGDCDQSAAVAKKPVDRKKLSSKLNAIREKYNPAEEAAPSTLGRNSSEGKPPQNPTSDRSRTNTRRTKEQASKPRQTSGQPMQAAQPLSPFSQVQGVDYTSSAIKARSLERVSAVPHGTKKTEDRSSWRARHQPKTATHSTLERVDSEDSGVEGESSDEESQTKKAAKTASPPQYRNLRDVLKQVPADARKPRMDAHADLPTSIFSEGPGYEGRGDPKNISPRSSGYDSVTNPYADGEVVENPFGGAGIAAGGLSPEKTDAVNKQAKPKKGMAAKVSAKLGEAGGAKSNLLQEDMLQTKKSGADDGSTKPKKFTLGRSSVKPGEPSGSAGGGDDSSNRGRKGMLARISGKPGSPRNGSGDPFEDVSVRSGRRGILSRVSAKITETKKASDTRAGSTDHSSELGQELKEEEVKRKIAPARTRFSTIVRDTDGNIIEKVDEEETDADKSKVSPWKKRNAAREAAASALESKMSESRRVSISYAELQPVKHSRNSMDARRAAVRESHRHHGDMSRLKALHHNDNTAERAIIYNSLHLIPLQRGVDDPRGPAREAQPKNTLRSAKSYTQRKAQDIKDLESSTSQGHSTLASVKTAPAQMGGPPPRDNGLHRSSVTGLQEQALASVDTDVKKSAMKRLFQWKRNMAEPL